jgi:hypothetical protein
LVAGRADALDVRQGAFIIETIGEGQVFGMVCDGNVVIPARLCCFCHFRDGVAAISFHGMHVHVALQVGLGNYWGQSMLGGSINLAEIYANLRYEVQFELANLLFSFLKTGFQPNRRGCTGGCN